jgi:hypothetical protein
MAKQRTNINVARVKYFFVLPAAFVGLACALLCSCQVIAPQGRWVTVWTYAPPPNQVVGDPNEVPPSADVYAAPSTSSKVLGALEDSVSVEVICIAEGNAVYGAGSRATSTLWDKIEITNTTSHKDEYGYLPDANAYSTNSNGIPGAPHCAGSKFSLRPISIAGTWLGPLGHKYYFKSTGGSSYLGEEVDQPACSPADISLTEESEDVRLFVGTVPLYNGCSPTGQKAIFAMQISADGKTAQVSADSTGCGNCGPPTIWTRVSKSS